MRETWDGEETRILKRLRTLGGGERAEAYRDGLTSALPQMKRYFDYLLEAQALLMPLYHQERALGVSDQVGTNFLRGIESHFQRTIYDLE